MLNKLNQSCFSQTSWGNEVYAPTSLVSAGAFPLWYNLAKKHWFESDLTVRWRAEGYCSPPDFISPAEGKQISASFREHTAEFAQLIIRHLRIQPFAMHTHGTAEQKADFWSGACGINPFHKRAVTSFFSYGLTSGFYFSLSPLGLNNLAV